MQLSPINLNKAIALKNAGKFKESYAMYQELIKTQGNIDKVWYNMGILCVEMENIDEAINCYERAININPDYYKAWNNLGTLHLKNKNYEDAAECFQHAVDIVPDDAIGWVNLGNALFKLGKYNDALNMLDNAFNLNITSDIQIEALYLKGLIYHSTHKISDAINIFKQLIEMAPYDNKLYEYYYYIATFLDNSGKSDEAMPYMKKSLELKSDFIPGLQTMGCILIHLKKNKEAIPYLLKVHETNPTNWEGIYNLACAYAGLPEEEEKAKNYLIKSLIHVPPSINLKSHVKNDPDWVVHKNKNWFKEL